MVIPMRKELTRLSIQELRTAAEVDPAIARQPGITMLVIKFAGRETLFRPTLEVVELCKIANDYARR